MTILRFFCRGFRIAITASLASSQSTSGTVGIYRNGTDSAPCDSPLFCYGKMLNDIQLARPFSDSKTFVDMATKGSLSDVQAAFDLLPRPLQNGTELIDFLSTYFSPAGRELVPVTGENITMAPQFLPSMNNPINSEFVFEIMMKWENLTRRVNQSSLCATCESSFIPPKRPFVVAGGRFREAYYWDSYWIIQGLLRTSGSFTGIAKNQILNFLDNVEQFGFVPNGGRKYYLNRSQPPLLSQMVKEYVDYTNDTSILDRAIPLLIKEYDFFVQRLSVSSTFGAENDTKGYTLSRYNVENNQPRPESYREDWQQANNASFYAASGMMFDVPILTQDEKDQQYRNLASGAESGWDFTSRFLSRPQEASADVSFPLRSINVINIIPVDLNSFMYWNEVTIAGFLTSTGQNDIAAVWADEARKRAEAMHAMMWSPTYNSYFDYNMTSGTQEAFTARDPDALDIDIDGAPTNDTQLVFNVAQLLPFLTGAALPEIKDNATTTKRAFERIARYLDTRPGGIAPTNLRTTQQWDRPDVWPPHMQLLTAALLQTPTDDPDWQWAHDLALRMGQRYLNSAYCTWRGTGGETESSPKMEDLPVDQDLGGLMFEKYSDQALHEAGGGGEYEVVVGFGWSNGVLIWIADTFRDKLVTPPCGPGNPNPGVPPLLPRGLPPLQRLQISAPKKAVELDPFDARFISKSCGGLA